jgi:alanine dehydrogenase
MQWIGADRIDNLLDFPALVAWLENAHRHDVDALDDLLLSRPAGEATRHFLLRAAWQDGLGLGAKLVTVFPESRPSVRAVYLLFDAATGEPRAALDGTALTYWKTAADSALGAKYLARPDAARLLMVGAGALAPWLIRAHRAVRPSLRAVRIWNRTPDRAARLAGILAAEGIAAEPADDLERAVGEADVISCATLAPAPLILGEWLRPGTHLDLVGAFTPDMREADDAAVRRAKIFVDARQTAVEPIGELAIPLRRGIIAARDILADHFQLCRGLHPGRESPADITLFKNGGGGHLDLMTAGLVLARDGELG